MLRLFLCLLAFSLLPLPAQLGPDPFPGGRTSGQQSPSGIPWPRRKKNGSENGAQERLKTTSGKVREVKEKTLSIDADDGRVVEFKRTDKTKVFEQEKELKVADLHPLDVVSVDYVEDTDGYFYCRDIRITGRAPAPKAAPPAAGKDDTPAEPVRAATLPPVVGDVDEEDAPKLRRGIPAHSKAKRADDDGTIPPPPPGYIPPKGEPAMASESTARAENDGGIAEDPLITKAREAAQSFSDRLPNYICTEFMTRYQSDTRPVDWRPLDVVSTEIVYQNGKEDYRKVAINGKQTKKAINEIDGAWSTGEFNTTLVDLLSPASHGSFFSRGQTTIGGITARVFDFRVEKANSHWHIQVAGQWIQPAYKGTLWLDPNTGRALRIEMQSAFLPDEFPLDQVESAIDYEAVRLGAGRYLLPVHAENLACQRFSRACSRSVIEFRNYHVFGSDTTISFDENVK